MNAIPSAAAVWTPRITTRRAVDQHSPESGCSIAADDLHQGGLAGAVLAEQRDDLPGVHLEAHAAQRVHAGKRLSDRAKLKERFARLVQPARGSLNDPGFASSF